MPGIWSLTPYVASISNIDLFLFWRSETESSNLGAMTHFSDSGCQHLLSNQTRSKTDFNRGSRHFLSLGAMALLWLHAG